MDTKDKEALQGKWKRLQRGLRPLTWWIIFVLLLYVLRTHDRLHSETSINFAVALEGQSLQRGQYEAYLDGNRIDTEAAVPLGQHRLLVKQAKAEPFETKVFLWYGENLQDEIDLVRMRGTLAVSLDLPAERILVSGPEMRFVLTNSTGFTASVPSDHYTIETRYPFSRDRAQVYVGQNYVISRKLAHRFGAVKIEGNQSDISYELLGTNQGRLAHGRVPDAVTQLPAGSYEVVARRGKSRRSRPVTVNAFETNNVRLEFVYASVTVETEPPGAKVMSTSGDELGVTPITVNEVETGMQQFRLLKEGYETVIAEVRVSANDTNYFQTNLVDVRYGAALRLARDYYSSGQYEEAARAADEALKYKVGDGIATSLKREATGLWHVARAKAHAEHGEFLAAVAELKSASEMIPENAQIAPLMAGYSKQQRELEEHEALKRDKERAEQERQARVNSLKMSLVTECRRHRGFEVFAVHELSSTKDIKELATVIANAMTLNPPAFETARYEWQHGDLVMEFKQGVFDGSRNCVIVGGQVSTNESLICFRVIESQTPHGFNWAGGLISAQLTTEEDRNGQRAARFEQQIKDGAAMVEERIRRAIGLK